MPSLSIRIASQDTGLSCSRLKISQLGVRVSACVSPFCFPPVTTHRQYNNEITVESTPRSSILARFSLEEEKKIEENNSKKYMYRTN